jgi:hypothetical protein
MTQNAAQRRHSTNARETGRYLPRRFNRVTRERFLRARRRAYLARISSTPSDAQSAMIQSLGSLEWAALAAEAEGGLVGFREAREHRRLFQRFLGDFERSLAAVKPDRPQSLSEVLAQATRERLAREATATT